MAGPNDTVPRKTSREARRPFGSTTQKLAYPARPHYHRHWFNDTPGRVEEALQAGYTNVEDKEGKRVVRVVGVSPSGGPLNAYLMEIPEEWYQEDMVAQQKRVDEMDSAIRRGAVAGTPGVEGRYIPDSFGGIKIKDGRGN